MQRMAQRIAPYRPDFWDDMIQAGYVSIWKSSKSYKPGEGSFGGYAHIMVNHSMRREFHKLHSNEMGKCLNSVIRGEGEINRVYLNEEGHHSAMCSLPDENEDLERELLRKERSFLLRRAVWRAADRLGAVFVPWKNAVIRERILSDRSTLKNICDRFEKNRNSVYHFERKMIELIKEEMRGDDDSRG
jgi:RNA polymerase sigma factor (sigma-70 family)